ncbi:uncharacterized protein LOC128235073 [Mya arenaria]|uniref:uncharacterized protein LOC128235073 n=1 Tax=Mya arenaria TaxID=6604 RepID=UPI0022E1F4F3|nr:uncharacterized protein LOC128235073 [Mya arenaria]
MGARFAIFIYILIGGTFSVDAENETELSFPEQQIDGSVLIKIGDNMNSPFMKLVGHAFRNMERKIEKQMCKTCSEWSPWSLCSAVESATFGVRSRSRPCWYQQKDCVKSGRKTFENETALCEGFCSPGFNFTQGGLCLSLHVFKLDKHSAEQSCQKYGGHILNTDTEDRWNQAIAIAASENIDVLWVDGQRSQKGGEWSFIHGHDPETNGVTSKWLTGEPSNGSSELCRVIDFEQGGYTWCDRSCTSEYPFICEIRS